MANTLPETFHKFYFHYIFEIIQYYLFYRQKNLTGNVGVIVIYGGKRIR